MDILVIIMLALFLIIIALSVVIYVIVRRNSIDKKFDKRIDSYLDNLDDDEEDEFVNLNIVMPSSFKNNEQENNNVEKEDVKIEEKVLESKETKNEIDVVEIKGLAKTEINDYIKEVEQVVPPKNEEQIQELINVLINRKNYIFLANNNNVSKNDYIKLILDGKVYFGIITKANYKKDISQFKVKPRKLNIVKKIVQNEQTKKEENKLVKEEIVEFFPKKKEKM